MYSKELDRLLDCLHEKGVECKYCFRNYWNNGTIEITYEQWDESPLVLTLNAIPNKVSVVLVLHLIQTICYGPSNPNKAYKFLYIITYIYLCFVIETGPLN